MAFLVYRHSVLESMTHSEIELYTHAYLEGAYADDSVSISETFASLIDILALEFAETIGITDRAVIAIDAQFSESISIADIANIYQFLSLADSMGITDLGFSGIQIFQNFFDSLAIAEDLSSDLKDTAKYFSDTLVISDSITGMVAIVQFSDDMDMRDYKSLGISGAFAVIRDMHLDDLYTIEGILVDVSWNN